MDACWCGIDLIGVLQMKLVLVCEFHRPFVTKSAFNQIEDEETGIIGFLSLESLLIVKERLRT